MMRETLVLLMLLAPIGSACASSPPIEYLRPLMEDEWLDLGVTSSAAVVTGRVSHFDVTAFAETLGVKGGVALRHTVFLTDVEWLVGPPGPDTLRVYLPPDWPHARVFLTESQKARGWALLHLNTWRLGWKIDQFDQRRPGGSKAVRALDASELQNVRVSVGEAVRRTSLDSLSMHADLVVIGRTTRLAYCTAGNRRWICMEVAADSAIAGRLRPGPVTIVPNGSQTHTVGTSIMFLREMADGRYSIMASDGALLRITPQGLRFREPMTLETAVARIRAAARQP
jgi:hypothetical protein